MSEGPIFLAPRIAIEESDETLPPESPMLADALRQAWASVSVTTAPHLEGYAVVETLDIISAECVFGMNLFRDWFASLTDIFGGRSVASQRVLRDARRVCLSELRREAYELGANAVIAVSLDYGEISGGGKSMLMLVGTGTAVRVERETKFG